jgi:arsenate reductase
MLHTITVISRGDAAGSDLVDVAHAAVATLVPGFDIDVRRGEANEVRVNDRPVGPTDRSGEEPPAWMIEAAIAHALEPRHILFMCVANSARSQMAEAMARALAHDGVTISSAGSTPSEVRPEAIAVLEELGVDTDGLRSKGTDDVDTDSVQLLITLCAEEVCPTILRPVPHLHWALRDPAAVEGDAEARLDAFRTARDTLRERLYVLFR